MRVRWGLVGALAIAVIIALALGWGSPNRGVSTTTSTVSAVMPGEAVMFRTSTCGCCEEYEKLVAVVFEAHGYSFRVEVVDGEELYSVKRMAGVPEAYMSCHTITADGYFVEGHVPLKAVKNLLEERPADVAGLASLHSELNKETWQSYHYYVIYKDGSATRV